MAPTADAATSDTATQKARRVHLAETKAWPRPSPDKTSVESFTFATARIAFGSSRNHASRREAPGAIASPRKDNDYEKFPTSGSGLCDEFNVTS